MPGKELFPQYRLSGLWNGKARSWTHQIVQRLKERASENAPGGRACPGPRFFEPTVGMRFGREYLNRPPTSSLNCCA